MSRISEYSHGTWKIKEVNIILTFFFSKIIYICIMITFCYTDIPLFDA